MVYNQGFPMNYQGMNYYPQFSNATQYSNAVPQMQPPQPQFQMQQPFQPQIPQSDIDGAFYVEGIASAKAWPVAVGKQVVLMDSNEKVFYIKKVDENGRPTTTAYVYQEKTEDSSPSISSSSDTTEYVTKDELEQRLFNLITEINNNTNNNQKEDNSNERKRR